MDRDVSANGSRPWLPACIAKHGFTKESVQSLSYLVVEEVVEEVTAITISPWPVADAAGRVRFEPAEPLEIAVTTKMLHDQVYRNWLHRNRRVGDVFAARVERDVLDEATDGVWGGPLARLLPGPIYDITAEARTVARLALYAVRGDILTKTEAAANAMVEKAVRNNRPANHRDELPAGDAIS
jgi:hypothetical protein